MSKPDQTQTTEHDWKMAAILCRDVAELPDRTSPDDNADFMLVQPDELQPMIAEALAAERERCYKRAFDAMHHGTFNQRVLDAIRRTASRNER